MKKTPRRPSTLLYPLPAVMVSCGLTPEEYNIITIAWTGTINSTPPMCYISVRPERHSYKIIEKNMEFVINLTPGELTEAMDWCGVNSGKNYNKFEKLNLTPGKAQKVNCPIIAESPVNIECKVTDIKKLGSHDMFIAEVVAISTDDGYDDFDNLVCYSHGKYHNLGDLVGYYGYAK